ncbi:MAG: ATP-binding cassette domain-containing protein [Thermoleophilaceae bacterium]
MTTVIATRALAKRYGRVRAVDGIDLDVRAGDVYGFLGANGSGKTTTVRMLLGLVLPTGGEVEVLGGRMPRAGRQVLPRVGALIEGPAAYGHLSGRENLTLLDASGPGGARRTRQRRIDDVLEQVGLAGVGRRAVRGYSLGMRQRLGLAGALLRRPELLILDEPTNGLDPPGIRWVRDLLRAEAARGRAVLVSSHLLSEVEQSVDEVVVIAKGVMRASGPIEHVLGGGGEPIARVRSADCQRLAGLLRERGIAVDGQTGDLLLVHGVAPEAVGEVAAEHRVVLRELGVQTRSLEEAFFELTEHGV